MLALTVAEILSPIFKPVKVAERESALTCFSAPVLNRTVYVEAGARPGSGLHVTVTEFCPVETAATFVTSAGGNALTGLETTSEETPLTFFPEILNEISFPHADSFARLVGYEVDVGLTVAVKHAFGVPPFFGIPKTVIV